MRVLTKMADAALNRARVTVDAMERVLVLRKGRIDAILTQGEHVLPRAKDLTMERHSLTNPQVTSAYAQAILRDRADLVETHMVLVQPKSDEAIALFRDGALFALAISPKDRILVWRDAGPWETQTWPIGPDCAAPEALRAPLRAFGATDKVVAVEVPQGHVAQVFVDGVDLGFRAEGRHLFWKQGKVEARLLDTRWTVAEVNGQEILTADRVSLRVNIAAQMRVVDPAKTAAARNHAETLRTALQLAFRKTLGALTLDQLLADKVAVDATAADKVRAEMAEIGLEVGEIALKDVILPGEMRDILNRVVAAEKEAEANVIRRREETQATRALLNTAKVMAENPVMLRLKELEALQEVAGKVERLTVHNGADGLLNDLVRLRD